MSLPAVEPGTPPALTAPQRLWVWRPYRVLTLRLKTLLLSALVGGLILAALYGLTRSFLVNTVLELERTYILQDIGRVQAALGSETERLVSVTRDYANWDETLRFIETHNRRYIQDNLQPQSTSNLRLDLMLFLDERGRLVHEVRSEGAAGNSRVRDADLSELAREYPDLLRQSPFGSGASGLVLLSGGPVLLTAQPVRDSSGAHPGRGTLVCGRFVDPDDIARMAKLSHQKVQLGRATEIAPATGVDQSPVSLTYLSPTHISAACVLPDVEGQRTILMRLDAGRPVYQQVLHMAYRLLLLILLGGLGLLLTMLLSQERLVFQRLSALSASLHAIGREPDPAARVPVQGHDELSVVASAVNETLAALEVSQREARVSAERFRQMTNLLPDILFEADAKGRFTYANSAAFESCGYTLADLQRGVSLHELVAPEELPALKRDLEAVVVNLKRRIATYHVRRKDGTSFLCEINVTPIIESNGTCGGVRGVGRDVSEREEIEQAQRMATVGQLAAGVAHEFNNILGGMLGQAEMNGNGCARCHKLSDAVIRGVEHGSLICRDLLRFARPRPLTRQSLPVEEPLEAALQMAERELRNADITVQRRYETRGWHVSADAAQLEQVFLNLIINACHAMPDGGTLAVETRYGGRGQMVIRVQDTGVGIAPENLQRVFEPFFTTKHEAGARVVSGAGLGLSVTMGIVHAHGGALQAESRLGEGSCFTIRLAACPADEAVSVNEEESPLTSEDILAPNYLVLLAEDDEAIRSTLQSLLELKGYRVQIAENTAETLALLDKQEFDLVISDYLMPGGGGREIIKALRDREKRPKMIMITGLADEELFRELTQSGVDRCLSKPFRLAVLLETIEEILGRRN
ncbi:MAG: CHASE4 domain-containing protein [Armatimonadia bacterium]